MGFYWKASHIWWRHDHIAWASNCCECADVVSCATAEDIYVPSTISVTVSGITGSQATGKCSGDPVAVPQMSCTGAASTLVTGSSTNKCNVMNGTWEIYDNANCTNRFGATTCVGSFTWTFCDDDCGNNNGGAVIQVSLFADSGVPKWGVNLTVNSDGCPLVTDVSYDYKSSALPTTGGIYNAIGTFTLTGYSGIQTGTYCSLPGTVSLTAA